MRLEWFGFADLTSRGRARVSIFIYLQTELNFFMISCKSLSTAQNVFLEISFSMQCFRFVSSYNNLPSTSMISNKHKHCCYINKDQLYFVFLQ